MADLLDIAPQTAVEIVRIEGRRIKVRGLSISTMATLVSRFPKLKDLMNGDFGDNFMLRLIEGVGTATAAIIAAGCGHCSDAEYEQSVDNFLPEHQLKLLKAIFGLTFPNGIGFFVEELTSLMSGPGEEAKPIKMRSKKLPSTSPPSSDAEALHPTLQ
jgi:hypothetical protein